MDREDRSAKKVKVEEHGGPAAGPVLAAAPAAPAAGDMAGEGAAIDEGDRRLYDAFIDDSHKPVKVALALEAVISCYGKVKTAATEFKTAVNLGDYASARARHGEVLGLATVLRHHAQALPDVWSDLLMGLQRACFNNLDGVNELVVCMTATIVESMSQSHDEMRICARVARQLTKM
ncbi:hypothetical protein JKP88DRAFT_223304 [Tribonema minus]|uniref:Uncharacterized protein n=1 Tax=Tribonema minus TaxID=303371 RepID=A0A835YSD7_9STRA|nr:hypothetical protein JKP88DRAFT_223304 [Tribonema minus]